MAKAVVFPGQGAQFVGMGKDLYESNMSFGDSNEYSVVNYSAMQFTLDDSYKTLEPIGKRSSSLSLDASYILAKNDILELIGDKLSKLNISNILFLSKFSKNLSDIGIPVT